MRRSIDPNNFRARAIATPCHLVPPRAIATTVVATDMAAAANKLRLVANPTVAPGVQPTVGENNLGCSGR
jgi:hypothetical protein